MYLQPGFQTEQRQNIELIWQALWITLWTGDRKCAKSPAAWNRHFSVQILINFIFI